MGDRGNILIKESKGGEIYFYSHWAGSMLAETAKAALIRGRGRWDDEQYLSRIIFSEMIKDELLETTGYGISTYQGDGHVALIVDIAKQQVTTENGETLSFEKFTE